MPVPYSLEGSIDRIEECKYLIGLLSDIQKLVIPPYRRVLHVYGKSRGGKSWLLNLYNDILSTGRQHLLPAKYKELLPKDNNLRFRPVFVSLDKLVDFTGVLITEVDETEFTKSVLKQIAKAMGIDMFDTSWSVTFWTDQLVKNIRGLENGALAVFLFDEVSSLPEVLVNRLEDHVLAPLLYKNNVVFVIGGRYKVTSWKDFQLRPDKVDNVLELTNFDFDTTCEQIENRKPTAKHLEKIIFGLGRGSPGNNDDILDTAKGMPLVIDELEAIKICNSDVWMSVGKKFEQTNDFDVSKGISALEALCVLQDFDKDYEVPVLFSVHADLQDIRDNLSVKKLLGILSDINIGPGRLMDWDRGKSAYAIEEQIRINLEQELKIRDQDLWRTLHCTAMNMYTKWATEYPDTDIFTNKSEYHKSQLAAAGLDPDDC